MANSYQRLHPQTPPTLSANCRLQWHCESPPLGCDHRFEPTEPSGPPSQWFSLWCHAVCTKIDGVCKCIETDVNPTNNDGSHGFEPLKWFFSMVGRCSNLFAPGFCDQLHSSSFGTQGGGVSISSELRFPYISPCSVQPDMNST